MVLDITLISWQVSSPLSCLPLSLALPIYETFWCSGAPQMVASVTLCQHLGGSDLLR